MRLFLVISSHPPEDMDRFGAQAEVAIVTLPYLNLLSGVTTPERPSIRDMSSQVLCV